MFILAEIAKNLLEIAFLVFKEKKEKTNTTNKTRKIKTNNAAVIKIKIETCNVIKIKIVTEKERTNINRNAQRDNN